MFMVEELNVEEKDHLIRCIKIIK